MTVARTEGRFAVDVSTPLEGCITDWPSNIQDKIYALVLNQSMEDGKPYEIFESFCDVDPLTGVASLIVRIEARYKVS